MLQDHAVFARALAGDAGLAGLSLERATDITWTISSPEVYQRLVRWRDWTPDHYEDWVAKTLERLLLG
jgi:hypothetical protein